eukprot:gene3163-6243_t
MYTAGYISVLIILGILQSPFMANGFNGDHYCNAAGGYNTLECNWDGGDCCEQTCGGYPACGAELPFDCLDPTYAVTPTAQPVSVPANNGCNVATPSLIGDHYCNAVGGYNSAECNWDGGDCCEQSCGGYPTCGTELPFDCLDPTYAATPNTTPTSAPATGGGGSNGCNVEIPSYLGDHYCDNASNGYNTAACNWDGGDCCVQTCGGYSTCGSEQYPFYCLDPNQGGPTLCIGIFVEAINMFQLKIFE